jgi:hypothetical protein
MCKLVPVPRHSGSKSTNADSRLGTADDGCILPELSGNGIMPDLPGSQPTDQSAIPSGAPKLIHRQYSQKHDVSTITVTGWNHTIPVLHLPRSNRLLHAINGETRIGCRSHMRPHWCKLNEAFLLRAANTCRSTPIQWPKPPIPPKFKLLPFESSDNMVHQ